MTNSAEQLIYHALSIMEADGDAEHALQVLAEASEVARMARRQVELVRARTLSGELLLELGRFDEARLAFDDVIAVGQVLDPTLVGEEVDSARSHIAFIDGRAEPERS